MKPYIGSPQNRYRGFDVPGTPVGSAYMASAPISQDWRIEPRSTIELLASCSSYRPLAEHALRFCEARSPSPVDPQWALRELERGVALGLLVAETDLIDGTSPGGAPSRITTICIPTRARPAALKRCLASYMENAAFFGRDVAFAISDDTASAAARQQTRGMLRGLAQTNGTAIHYAGAEEKRDYTDALACRGIPKEVAEFALFNLHNAATSAGACRNALLLHTVGETLLCADDDTFCRTGRPPEFQPGLALTSAYDPTEFWFFDDIESASSTAQLASEDVLGLHERMLGADLKSYLASSSQGGAVDADGMDLQFTRSLILHGGRIACTIDGIVGDCAIGSTRHYLMLKGASHARLTRSEQKYRQALASRAAIRSVLRETVSSNTYCTSWRLGLDNRSLLPPFMPVHRNQDGIFGITLRQFFPNDYIGMLPYLTLHVPEQARQTDLDDLWRGIARLRTYDILRALILESATGLCCGGSTRMIRTGRALAELARHPGELLEAIRLQWMTEMNARLVQLEALMAELPDEPRFWLDDLQRYAKAIRSSVASGDMEVPYDLSGRMNQQDSLEYLQRMISDFGRLLEYWPGMMDIAAELKQHDRCIGQRLGVN